MVTKRTVFIVGAGASLNYGFPLGTSLMDALQETGEVATRFGYLDVDTREELSRFQDRLRDASPPSIDVFLEDNPDLVDIGKRCIARSLMQCEDHSSVIGPKPEDHWLKALWHDIKRPPSEFGSQPISFIIYNYDRLVEHFLTYTLSKAFPNVSDLDAWKHVRQFTFLHPHGQLAPYNPGVFEHESNSRSFILGGEQSWEDHQREIQRNNRVQRSIDAGTRHFWTSDVGNFRAESLAANGISLFWENHPSQQETRLAMTKVLKDAERIVFLGFGYLSANLDHLEKMWPRQSVDSGKCEVYGTCIGLAKKHKSRVLKLFGDPNRLMDLRCAQLISEHVPLD